MPTVTESPESTLPRLVATDFWGYLRPSRCPLRVWLRAQCVQEAAPGPFAEVLMRLGNEHERRHLARFPKALDLGPLPIEERAERTREAIAANERVVYQGALRAETTLAGTEVEVVGVPDFMLPARRGYAIRDSKLARRVGGGAHQEIDLQLQTYGLLYERTFGEPPVALQVHAGDGAILDVPYEGGAEALAQLEEILTFRLAAERPKTTVGWGKCSGCGYFERCWPEAVERRSVGLLPWVGQGLVGELESRGVETIDALLERFDAESLAEVEHPWGKKRKQVGEGAARILASAQALATGEPIVLQPPAIPEHPNYVMFDL